MAEKEKHESSGSRVFVSFAREDRGPALRIIETLRAADVRVFLDELELKVGDSIFERIDKALMATDLILVLLSPESVKSSWVEAELSFARNRELHSRAVTVIPAIIEDWS